MKAPSPITVRSGEASVSGGKAVRNKILLAISSREYRHLLPHLEPLQLPQGFTLHKPGQRVKFAYFLNHGLGSIVVAMNGDRDVEAGVVGLEGLVGTVLAVGLQTSPLRVVMQIAGDGFRISARAFESVLAVAPKLRLGVTRYAVLQGMQVAQTAACKRLHPVGQRLARWLLMAQDRVNDGKLSLTHDFLAIMLGTDRPSVTLAAHELQRKNAIRYRRASVEIVHRKRLEKLACECYRVIQRINGELDLA